MNKISSVLNVGMYVGVLTQTRELFQIIQLALSIITTLIILVINVGIWYKKASADGKITSDELEDLGDIVEDGSKQIKEKMNENK